MPPKLKLLPPKPVRYLNERGNETDDELMIGNICVGPSGVQFTGEGELCVPRPDIRMEKLKHVQQLGQGSQGSVSMYVNTDDSSVLAVKRMMIPSNADKGMKQTVASELRNIFSQRANDFTVALHNAFYKSGALHLVMEYMDWGNLEELLNCVGKPLPEPICAFIASQILHGLEILHTKSNILTENNGHSKGLRQIHRDIKPANVLLSTDGRVKLADFGVATSAETLGVNSFVGTATYMSPERIRGLTYSTPSDIWSVGVVIAQIISGRYPFDSVGKGFMALLREVTTIESIPLSSQVGCSSDAEDFINHCLRQLPDSRSTAAELLQHPWIAQNTEGGKEELISLLASIVGPHCRGDIPEKVANSATK